MAISLQYMSNSTALLLRELRAYNLQYKSLRTLGSAVHKLLEIL